MPHQVLIHRLVVRHEDRERRLALAAGAAGLLPGAGERRRSADQDRRVEAADVDAELERVGRDHAAELAREERLLDRAPLFRQVTAAIGTDAIGQVGRGALERLTRVAVDQLGRHA